MPQNFSLVKKGYSPEEVDSYIKAIEQQCNEYKQKSSSINNAIINAQIAADNIIKSANIHAEKILANAENEAYRIKRNTISQINTIKSSILEQKSLVECFYKEYNSLIKKYLRPIEDEDILPLISELNELGSLIDDFSMQVIKNERTNKEIEEDDLNNKEEIIENDEGITSSISIDEDNKIESSEQSEIQNENNENFNFSKIKPDTNDNGKYKVINNNNCENNYEKVTLNNKIEKRHKLPVSKPSNVTPAKLDYDELEELIPNSYKKRSR